MRETRRDTLKRGGATIAALSALSGCLGIGGGGTPTEAPDESEDGSDGNGGDGGDGEPTPTETPTATPAPTRPETPVGTLTRWMPDPALLDQTGDSGYAFLGVAPRALGEFEGALGEGALGQFQGQYPIPGVGTFGEQRALFRFARSASVLLGDFDRTAVEDGLRQYGFEAGDAYRGFRFFSPPDARAAAVRDGMLVTVGAVSSGDTTDKRPAVEAIVDARTGNADRYVDAVPDSRRLLDAIGSAHVLEGRTHGTGETFEQGLGEGTGYHVAEGETRVRAAALFTEGATNRSGMADWVDGADAFLGGEPTLRTDDRAVIATATVPTGDVTGFPGEFPGPAIERDSASGGPPTVSFDFAYVGEGAGVGVLTITHEGGDSVPREAVQIRGSGFAEVDGVDQTGAGVWQESVDSEGESITAGTTVEVGVASDYEIAVVWRPPGADRSATLATHEGPDA
ncbi:hypothetical protein C475_07065 [Halosimplex carlsbadense 2-9-1]|uniref:Uncharacterized protein n=1 Tax=Halosimplex carlsbadense 2-9-1 TaxID=797114 RepID=M0CWQ1_9EURY|nr:hypothetical protein [Halosimplex carlsbadense]ELZ27661.1 hypothetical protein C475_07065 [Halosimplex carlsbadense 2-9-1]